MPKQNTDQCKCQGACKCSSAKTKGSAQVMSGKSSLWQKLAAALPADKKVEIATDHWMESLLKADGQGGLSEDNGDVRILDQEIGAADDKVPPEGQVVTGPVQASSGGNAERMISQYSNPDPQQDIVVRYEQLSRELGSLRGSMKSMAEAIKAMLLAAKAEDDKDDDKEVEIDIADEIEGEDEKEAEKASAVSGPAKAAAVLFKAVMELEARAKAARKAGDLAKAKSLRGKIEATLIKALAMLKSAPDALALKTEIHAHALLKGMDAVVAKAEEEDKDEDEKKKESDEAPALDKSALDAADGLGKKEGHDNQETWASSEEGTDPGDVMKAQIEEVLKGNKMLSGKVTDLLSIVANQSRPSSLSVMDLPTAVKGQAPAPASAALLKSNPNAWAEAKGREMADFPFANLTDQLSAENVISSVQARQLGLIEDGVFKMRMRSVPSDVAALFPEILGAAE